MTHPKTYYLAEIIGGGAPSNIHAVILAFTKDRLIEYLHQEFKDGPDYYMSTETFSITVYENGIPCVQEMDNKVHFFFDAIDPEFKSFVVDFKNNAFRPDNGATDTDFLNDLFCEHEYHSNDFPYKVTLAMDFSDLPSVVGIPQPVEYQPEGWEETETLEEGLTNLT